jgi:hypothetical protein
MNFHGPRKDITFQKLMFFGSGRRTSAFGPTLVATNGKSTTEIPMLALPHF